MVMFAEKEIDHTTPDTMYTCRGKVVNNGGWERTVALERRREGDIFNTGNTTNYFRSVLAPSIVQHTSSVGDVHITCQFPPKAAVKHCRRSRYRAEYCGGNSGPYFTCDFQY